MLLIRPPVVAGMFYDLDKSMLKKQIDACFTHKLGPRGKKEQSFSAAVVPHAGYIYSGPIAAWVYSKIEQANYIILGPNHYGAGAKFAIMKKGLWKTPLGGIAVDEALADRLLNSCKLLEYDIVPHQHEHSIEVQLPFLQHRFGSSFKIVPISIHNEFANDTLLESCRAIGKAIAKAIKAIKDKWIVLASSDFSHFIPHELAVETDKYAIKAIVKLDEKRFFDRINEKNVSICGFGAIATAMVAAKELGAKKGKLLCYKTSGDVTGDLGSVVGYASIIMV